MKKYFSLVFVMLSILGSYAQQEVCETPDEVSIDVNSITKCTIEPVKNAKKKTERQIKVKVSASRRFLKKRNIIKKKKAQSLGAVSSAGVNEITSNDTSIETIASKNDVAKIVDLKSDIDVLKEKLSKEELSKAKKLYYVDKIPAFKKCYNTKKSERLDCFNVEMMEHINKHFSYPSEAVRNQIQGEVWVRFIINKNGYVTNIKTLGPDNGEILNEEVKRVVAKLPHFKPGRDNGKRVSVKYGFPINFSLEE